MSKAIPLIAIVGRTNVGKSTLFNLIAGKELAIVENQPGVTRDRNYIFLNNYTHPFSLVDTGGLLGEEDIDLSTSVREQSEIAIHEADLILAVFDGQVGIHPQDQEVVNLLRRSEKPVLWIANKCEKEEDRLKASELYGLGIETVHTISAAHNQGIRELMKAIWSELYFEDNKQIAEDKNEDRPIRVAILGKPNVGKSTFVNKLLGEQRLITSSMSGTTIDSVNVDLVREGQEFTLVDTAGLRKQKNVKQKTIEKLSNFRTLRSIAFSDVVLLLVDATLGEPSDQDAKIAELIHKRGKGLVIVVNKWDAIEKDHKTAKDYEKTVYDVFRFCRYAPILFVSALTGRRCPLVLNKVKDIFLAGQQRIQTADFNKIMERAVSKNTLPIYRGQAVKYYYGSQTDISPPTFVLFFNQPRKVNQAYQRYIKNSLRKHCEFEGYDLKLVLRKKTGKEKGE